MLENKNINSTIRLMDLKPYKQTTYETCLAACLLMLTGERYNQKDEITIWKKGWEFNYLIGQLNYFSKRYKKYLNVWIENKTYFRNLKEVKNNRINLLNSKIDTKLIKSLLVNGKVIIYLDNYFLQHITHYPHFVLGIGINKEDKIRIADPYDGKIKLVSMDVIRKGIISLRNHLKFSQVLIQEREIN